MRYRKQVLMRAVLIVAVISFLPIRPCVSSDEESLILAWEELQKSDPKTVEFKKDADGSYFFHTTRFPYQGRLIVLNTSIDDSSEAYEYYDTPTLMGVVEVDLPDKPDDFLTKHAHSYALWQQNNYLYHDREGDRWSSAKEWQSKLMKESTTRPCWSRIDLFWVFFLVILVPLLVLLSRKTSKQMKNAMQAQNIALEQQQKALDDQKRSLELSGQSLELQREMIAILKEIARNLARNTHSTPPPLNHQDNSEKPTQT